MLLACEHTHKLNKRNNSLPKPQLQDRRHVRFFPHDFYFFPNTSLPTHFPLLFQGVCWKTDGYGPRSCTSCSLQSTSQTKAVLPYLGHLSFENIKPLEQEVFQCRSRKTKLIQSKGHYRPSSNGLQVVVFKLLDSRNCSGNCHTNKEPLQRVSWPGGGAVHPIMEWSPATVPSWVAECPRVKQRTNCAGK